MSRLTAIIVALVVLDLAIVAALAWLDWRERRGR